MSPVMILIEEVVLQLTFSNNSLFIQGEIKISIGKTRMLHFILSCLLILL